MIKLALLSGLLILDKYAIGIFGLSQPIGAGLIFGLAFGRLSECIILGAYLQLIYLALLPVGRHIPPDGELGGITGLAIHILYPQFPLIVPFFFAVITSIFSGYTDTIFRQFNNLLYRKGIQAAAQEQITTVINLHLLGLPVAFSRGFITVLLLLLCAGQFDLTPFLWKKGIIVIPIAVGFASGLYLFFKSRRALYLIGGIITGWALQFLVG